MIVYVVNGSEYNSQLFRTLREAREAGRAWGSGDYYIEKCEMVKPSVDAMIDVINSQGGCWCMKRHRIVDAYGFWAEPEGKASLKRAGSE